LYAFKVALDGAGVEVGVLPVAGVSVGVSVTGVDVVASSDSPYSEVHWSIP